MLVRWVIVGRAGVVMTAEVVEIVTVTAEAVEAAVVAGEDNTEVRSKKCEVISETTFTESDFKKNIDKLI
jgi:hypothetical protein